MGVLVLIVIRLNRFLLSLCIRRSVVATGSFGAVLTLTLSCLFLYETPRFTSHILGDHQKAIEDLANQVCFCSTLVHDGCDNFHGIADHMSGVAVGATH